MPYKTVLVFLITIFLTGGSCRKEPCVCDIKNPEVNLPWLKIRLDLYFCVEVYSLVFEGEDYIVVCDCPGPDAMDVFYDCQGNKVCEYGGSNPGGETCTMPVGFTFEFYLKQKKLIYNKHVNP